MERTVRNSIAWLVAAVVMVLGVGAAQAAGCDTCDVALEQCAAGCTGLAAKAERVQCLLGCDNAAARCSCDTPVTLRSEDVVALRGLDILLAKPTPDAVACHSTTACDSSYGSCASWSGYVDCGDAFCGVGRFCGECIVEPCPGPALKQYQERYRLCFSAQGQSCTEYQRILTTLDCGC